MEQHPVPQQISSYEFRLVGDMTLKQFAQVAGGCLVALLFYASPLPGLFKWPLVILPAFAGAAFAFLPFEERPLQTWVIAFLKAVYSPTQFIWQKRGQKPQIFEEKTPSEAKPPVSPISPTPPKTTDYWSAFATSQIITEKEEQKLLERIQNLFSAVSQVIPPTPLPSPTWPVQEANKPSLETSRPMMMPVPQRQTWVVPSYQPPLPTRPFPLRRRKPEEVRFAPPIPMPSIPTLPNVLVGMVAGPEEKIIEGAIMEIRDSQGNPVRAFKTNKLGQFRTVTPLPNDTYEIEVEKEGLQFDLIKIELKGEIVQPIEIKTKEEKSEILNPPSL